MIRFQDGARPAEATSPRIREGGFTLVELLAVGILLVLAAAISLPAFARASRHGKLEGCLANLRTLHGASEAFYKDHKDLHAKARGRAYWTALAEATPRRVAPSVLQCPLATVASPPPSQYLGPAMDATTMGPDHVLGCDDGGNHSPNGTQGGNILRKSGEIVTDDGLLWRESVLKHCSN